MSVKDMRNTYPIAFLLWRELPPESLMMSFVIVDKNSGSSPDHLSIQSLTFLPLSPGVPIELIRPGFSQPQIIVAAESFGDLLDFPPQPLFKARHELTGSHSGSDRR